jgi:hypothetical protein
MPTREEDFDNIEDVLRLYGMDAEVAALMRIKTASTGKYFDIEIERRVAERSSLCVPSLRDQFAMQAMCGMLAMGHTEDRSPEYLGCNAYRIADGMLEYRNSVAEHRSDDA